MLSVYLPIAALNVNLFILLGLGGAVGFLSGLFGVGGGFLLTPLLIMIGIPPAVAAASGCNQFIASASSGALAHKRLGNVDVKLGIMLVLGGLIGSFFGSVLVKRLLAIGHFDLVIRIVYVLMLGVIGSFMFKESLYALHNRESHEMSPSNSRFSRWRTSLPWQMHFARSGVAISALFLLILGLIIGLLAAIMGVGGGFIMVPVMIYIIGMQTKVAIGTSLFQIAITCVGVTFVHAVLNKTVDIELALLLIAGATFGAQLGAKAAQRMRADYLRLFLAVIVLMVMGMMLHGLFVSERRLGSIQESTVSISAVSVNAEHFLYRLAHEYPYFYGLLAIALAVLASLAVSWLYNRKRSSEG